MTGQTALVILVPAPGRGGRTWRAKISRVQWMGSTGPTHGCAACHRFPLVIRSSCNACIAANDFTASWYWFHPKKEKAYVLAPQFGHAVCTKKVGKLCNWRSVGQTPTVLDNYHHLDFCQHKKRRSAVHWVRRHWHLSTQTSEVTLSPVQGQEQSCQNGQARFKKDYWDLQMPPSYGVKYVKSKLNNITVLNITKPL